MPFASLESVIVGDLRRRAFPKENGQVPASRQLGPANARLVKVRHA
jgi:hypothetical protein